MFFKKLSFLPQILTTIKAFCTLIDSAAHLLDSVQSDKNNYLFVWLHYCNDN